MLAVFEKAIAHAPAGLDARVHLQGTASAKNQELTGMSGLEILNAFKERQVAVHFGQGSGLAYSLEHQRELLRPRAFVSQESVFLLFKGHLSNMNKLRQMYGITKAVTEELLIIEVYKALRDRAPYPADVAVKHLEGNFGFVLFDQSNSTIFAATVSPQAHHFDLSLISFFYCDKRHSLSVFQVVCLRFSLKSG
eukprot:TRINITY_DN1240_c0_g1_i2.p1 TRINITY_DN1240_c0_g1~~TRINITY_DN1240_c0_g1_i2.p1  ORF type:complete len:194 (+),score=39.29 TRINITY_DN1240_c0_g1_i2:239-820(+)